MKRLLVAGGGTGGHIYPAIAIAQVLKKVAPEIEVHFVGTAKGLEKKIVPREGYPLHLIKVGALNQVGVWTKLFSIILLPLALFQSVILILKLKPKAVLGVGGYASGPAVLAAWLMRIPTFLFEPNAQPGLTNRWLAPIVKRAFLNFSAAEKFFKDSEIVGIPVRSGLIPRSQADLMDETGTARRLEILIFGGSQGARGINNTVLEAVRRGGEWLSRVSIVHQIGSTDFEKFKEEYERLKPLHVNYFEFLFDMPERYTKADLVICRAGASTLAELASCHKASIVVPFPQASDNHQQKNAEALVAGEATVMILQKDFTPEKLVEAVNEFYRNPNKISELEFAIAKFCKHESAERIVAALRKEF